MIMCKNRLGSVMYPVCRILNLRRLSLTQGNLASKKEEEEWTIRISNKFRYSNCMHSTVVQAPGETNAVTHDHSNAVKHATQRLPISADLVKQEEINESHSSSKLRKPSKLKLNIRGEIVYGVHPVHLALLSKRRDMFQLYVYRKLARSPDELKGRIYQLALDLQIPIKEVSRNTLSQLSHGHVSQGVCLDASKLKMENFEEISAKNTSVEDNSFCLLLDRIQDPMNFGAVLRSCYYFGVNKVFTVKESSCKLTPVVSKASSGAMEILPVYAINDLIEFLELKKERGWRIIGSDEYSISPDQKYIGIDKIEVTTPTVFILGNEGTGMSRNIYDLCDNIITIKPNKNQYPDIGSLNVSVVCGIVLHQLLGRQSS